MFCRECGKMVQDGNKFCTGCGTKIQPITIKTSKERINKESIVEVKKVVSNQSQINNNHNIRYNSNINVPRIKDKYSIGFNILAFLVPIVGLVLFLVMKKDTPKKAKGIGISALIGYISSIVVSIIYVIFVFLITFMTLENNYDNNKWKNYDYEYNEHFDDYKYDFEREYDFKGKYNI